MVQADIPSVIRAEKPVTKCILAPLVGTGLDELTLGAALAVARRFDGHVAALHARPDPDDIAAQIAGSDLGGTWGMDAAVANIQAAVAARAEAAERGFARFCTAEAVHVGAVPGRAGASASLTMVTGRQVPLLAQHGRTADLVALGLGRDGAEIAWEVIESVLFGSGRPMLLARTQPGDAFARTVVIAWKDTPDAARAVGAAAPFIARADRVVILCVDEHDGSAGSSPARLMRALRWHNAEIRLERLYSNEGTHPAATLLAAATASQAGLLVMGGYGHSRLREWVFGGFTNHVLRHATLPVLMMH